MPNTPFIQLKDSSIDASVYPVTMMGAVMDASLSDSLNTYITEYNISEHQTNNSESERQGTNTFNLTEAISQVPDEYKRGGLRLTFYNDEGGLESYMLDSSVWSNIDSSWASGKGVIDEWDEYEEDDEETEI